MPITSDIHSREKPENESAPMPSKKQLDSAAQLKAISKALMRERQIENWQKELKDKIATLESQYASSERQLEEQQAVLGIDPALTTVAREMLSEALEKQSGDDFQIYNPNYVTSDDKEKLLANILSDFKAENSDLNKMPFGMIKAILKSRYKIETPSAGLFFRNQLKNYETTGGNKSKFVCLKK